MSTAMICDWCGEDIASRTPHATLSVAFSDFDERDMAGYFGHFHSGDLVCWREAHKQVKLALDTGASLSRIPVATPQKIGAIRRAHRRRTPSTRGAVTVEMGTGPLLALAGLAGQKAAELADLLEMEPVMGDPAVAYLRDLAGGARALLGRLPASVHGDLAGHVERLSEALPQIAVAA